MKKPMVSTNYLANVPKHAILQIIYPAEVYTMVLCPCCQAEYPKGTKKCGNCGIWLNYGNGQRHKNNHHAGTFKALRTTRKRAMAT
jgi:hypothetical protein